MVDNIPIMIFSQYASFLCKICRNDAKTEPQYILETFSQVCNGQNF